MSKKLKLNQVIAIEKGVKSRAQSEVTAVYKAAQKPQLYEGQVRSYRSLDENGATWPNEKTQVRRTVEQDLKTVRKLWSEAINVTATKDYGNCQATADVVVDGKVVVAAAPVTFLLYLEKKLTELRNVLDVMPTLSTSERWSYDENLGVYESEKSEVNKTIKAQKAIVLYDATEHHPAQTQLITEDQLIGFWGTVKHSGAMRVPEKTKFLERVDKLVQAVKVAREEANSLEVERLKVAEDVFSFVFED